MNERIDQLLVKAGAVFGGEGIDYSNFDPKKFAQLFLRECVEKCVYVVDRQEILAHFGVEE
jgi:hypothetical protein